MITLKVSVLFSRYIKFSDFLSFLLPNIRKNLLNCNEENGYSYPVKITETFGGEVGICVDSVVVA